MSEESATIEYARLVTSVRTPGPCAIPKTQSNTYICLSVPYPNDANGIARARSATVQERIRTLIIPGSTGRSHEDSGSIEDRSLWIPQAGNLPHLGVGLF